MPARIDHSILRRVAVAGALLLAGLAAGCAMMSADRWNLDRYRDERAVEIEGRLSRDEPVVADPF